ncbi:hypothetical protein A8C56_07725 [Niabella ginsenosidivorans]|uniref:Uncharacterized protein n=1 Tax=Niabella ginsenosidivorans TaxID=1176587 RepID=A0A1A9I2H2_9BACT|nr:hypothetical protein [Niabella ginsenosidivorans]ANH80882.1 hypothetical protein A8C56_07725 [Niabella ginsenosidivorans]
MKQPLKILMQAGKKIIFWTSLILIFIFIIAPFVIRFTPLEFTSNNSLDSFEEFRFSGLPATILLTLFGTLKKRPG